MLVLSMHDDREVIREAVAAGVRGYVLKDSPPQVLAEAIEAVHCGDTYFSPAIAQTLIADYVAQSGRITHGRQDVLSSRELEVLTLVAQGFTNREIAQKLCISVRTVETHRERIREKLGIKTAAGLTRYAIAQGIIEEAPCGVPA